MNHRFRSAFCVITLIGMTFGLSGCGSNQREGLLLTVEQKAETHYAPGTEPLKTERRELTTDQIQQSLDWAKQSGLKTSDGGLVGTAAEAIQKKLDLATYVTDYRDKTVYSFPISDKPIAPTDHADGQLQITVDKTSGKISSVVYVSAEQ